MLLDLLKMLYQYRALHSMFTICMIALLNFIRTIKCIQNGTAVVTYVRNVFAGLRFLCDGNMVLCIQNTKLLLYYCHTTSCLIRFLEVFILHNNVTVIPGCVYENIQNILED